MFEQAFRNIDDALRKEAGCTTELDYTEQTSWLLFLKYLDGLEQDRSDEAALGGEKYTYIINKALTGDDLREFVNQELFPYLHGLAEGYRTEHDRIQDRRNFRRD